MTKRSTQEEDITIVNIYALSTGAPKFIKQICIDMMEEIGNNTLPVGDFNTPLTSRDKSNSTES